ncbi:MAG: hypothetical protein ACLFM7_07815 [Bacteroidales bacterium]
MAPLKKIIPFGVVSFFFLAALFSCVEDNLSDIRWDEEDHWKPDISIPLGKGSMDVDNYFEANRDVNIPFDTIPLYYEDSLYHFDEHQIAAEDSLDHGVKQFRSKAGVPV